MLHKIIDLKGNIAKFKIFSDLSYVINAWFWLILNKIFVFIFSFILMYVCGKFLSQKDFGIYQYILSAFGIASIASIPGANIALSRSVAKGYDGTLKFLINKRISLSFIGLTLMLLGSFWYIINGNFTLGILFFISGIALPYMNSYDSFEYFWSGKKEFRKSTITSGLSYIIPTTLVILSVIITKNVLVAFAVLLLGNTLARMFFTKKIINEIENDKIDTESWSLGKHLTIIQGIDILSSYIDKIVLWFFAGPIPLAIYTFAQTPIIKIQQLIPIQMIALPKLSESTGERDKKEILNKFWKLFLISAPLSILLALIASPIYKIFFPIYLDSVLYLQTLCILVLFAPFILIQTVFIADMQKKLLSHIQIFFFTIKVTAFLFLVPVYGIWGIVFPMIGTEFLKGLATLYYFKRN